MGSCNNLLTRLRTKSPRHGERSVYVHIGGVYVRTNIHNVGKCMCLRTQVDIWGWVGGFKIIFAPDNSIL